MKLTGHKARKIHKTNMVKHITKRELLQLCYKHIEANALCGWINCQVPKIRPISKKNINEVVKRLKKDGFEVYNQEYEIKIHW